jgi:hypothetical protein
VPESAGEASAPSVKASFKAGITRVEIAQYSKGFSSNSDSIAIVHGPNHTMWSGRRPGALAAKGEERRENCGFVDDIFVGALDRMRFSSCGERNASHR